MVVDDAARKGGSSSSNNTKKRRRGRGEGGGGSGSAKVEGEPKSRSKSKAEGKAPSSHNHATTNKHNKKPPGPAAPPAQAQQPPQQKHHPQQHGSLLIQLTEEEPTWYEYGGQLPGRNATAEVETGGGAPPSSAKRGRQQHRSKLSTSSSADMSSSAAVVVSKYRALGSGVYGREVQLASKSSTKTADDRWVESTMHQGTLKDRIAAMSVLVSNDPVHKLYALDGLLQLAGCHVSGDGHQVDRQSTSHSHSKPNSRVAQLAAQAMEDLFVNSLLPKDRKLVPLDRRPLQAYEQHTSGNGGGGKKSLSPRILLLWRIEEMVRDRYHAFVDQYLAKTLRDGMELDKKFCLRVASNLLKSVPEGEARLLALIVNKLGDPSRTICSSASHALRQVLQQHPAMRTVVAREVQQLAHRPRLPARALYNCVNFLSQVALDRTSEGQELAGSLMATYFRLFDVIAGHHQAKNKDRQDDGELLQSRLLSALLTGVSRAHPYLSKRDQALEGHMDTLYRVAHTATPAARTRALLLLFHVTVSTAAPDDGSDKAPPLQRADGGEDHREKRQSRFYRALYSTLSDPAMLGGGKHLTMYFNLLYKSIKHDPDSGRAAAFVKRVLTASLQCGSPVSAATIFLVHEIAKHHPSVTSSLAEPLVGSDALRVLDPTKREPRGAIVVWSSGSAEGTTEKAGSTAPPSSTHDRVGLWEVALLQHHYHPSVAKFATVVGTDDGLNYRGDPLRDFGLQPFLDKFSYRNPKTSERDAAKRESTVGQRRGAAGPAVGRDAVPLNDPSFLHQPSVDVQDEFFHKFFVERARRDEMKGIVRNKKATKAEEGDGAREYMDEQAALDEAEDWDGSKRFEDWEEKWETDPEEEAFVDSLTQRIIEDSIGKHGVDELDDEDPDMDGWDDLLSDDDRSDGESSDQEEMSRSSDVSPEGDAFMEEDESSDNSDDELEDGQLDGEDVVESFTGKGDGLLRSDSSSDEDEDDGGGDPAGADQSEDEDEADHEAKRSSRRKVQKFTSTYAALEDFEDRINESWFSLSRPAPAQENENVRGEMSKPHVPENVSRKKRRK